MSYTFHSPYIPSDDSQASQLAGDGTMSLTAGWQFAQRLAKIAGEDLALVLKESAEEQDDCQTFFTGQSHEKIHFHIQKHCGQTSTTADDEAVAESLEKLSNFNKQPRSLDEEEAADFTGHLESVNHALDELELEAKMVGSQARVLPSLTQAHPQERHDDPARHGAEWTAISEAADFILKDIRETYEEARDGSPQSMTDG